MNKMVASPGGPS